MDLTVEIDSRESCTCFINTTDLGKLKYPYISILGRDSILYLEARVDIKHGTIRINRDFAECLGLSPGCVQTFLVVTNIPLQVSSPIIVSPADVDDWEIIDSQAIVLEEIILSQIKVVGSGMKFPIFVARGQRPVRLIVKSVIPDQFSLLDIESELAVEARPREVLNIGKGIKSTAFLRVRVVDSEFPADVLGVGVLVNTRDFMNAFGSDGGCVVTIRDRSDILTIVACDSSIVDPGIALVSPLMRDVYGIVCGERIVIEQQPRNFNSDLVVPKRITVAFPRGGIVTEKYRIPLFTTFIEKAGSVIVPQGGYVDINCKPDGDPLYVRIHFTPIPPGIQTSKVAAILNAKQISNVLISTSELSDDLFQERPQPYLKYIPESVKDDSRKFGVISAEISQKIDLIIPSYIPTVERITNYIDSSFIHADCSLPFVGSLLLASSGSKTGKTSAVLKAISSLSPRVPFVRIDCRSLSNSERYKLTEVWETIQGLVRFAFESPPMILFFDDSDHLFADEVDDSDRSRKRGKILGELLLDLLKQLRPNRSIFLIGTAVRDSKLLGKIFLHKEVLPSKLSAHDRITLVPKSLEVDNYSLMELAEIAKTGKDNRELRRRLMANQSAEKALLSQSQQVTLGGLGHQIDLLFDAISLPLRMPFLFSGSKRSLVSSGAFVVGPSGTGKSALVDYIVRKVGLPSEIVRGPDLLDKYIGASEQAVRRVFEKAASIAPCVVVFDAIDALCPRRGSESTGVTDRVVNQMLCYLDGVDQVENVFVVAISSRPDMVDPALTRPGRLDLVVLCDIPDAIEKREIVSALWSDFVRSEPPPEVIDKITSSIHPACTGADIKAGFVNAKILSSRTEISINGDLVEKCMHEIKPSISEKDQSMYRSIFAKYKGEESTVPVGTRVMLR